MIDNQLVITEDLVIILPVCLSMTLTICYTLLCVGQADSVDPDKTPQNAASHQGLHRPPLVQLFLDTTLGIILYLFKF